MDTSCLSIMCRHYRDMLNQSIFIVADFGRYNRKVARLGKDVVAPYVHVLPSYDQDSSIDPFSLRKTLLFFQGRIHRKDVSLLFFVLLLILIFKSQQVYRFRSVCYRSFYIICIIYSRMNHPPPVGS